MTIHEKTKPNPPHPSRDGWIELSGDFVAFVDRWHKLTHPVEKDPSRRHPIAASFPRNRK